MAADGCRDRAHKKKDAQFSQWNLPTGPLANSNLDPAVAFVWIDGDVNADRQGGPKATASGQIHFYKTDRSKDGEDHLNLGQRPAALGDETRYLSRPQPTHKPQKLAVRRIEKLEKRS
ncbi:hypothetical protein [Hyphomicrobium sp. 1Nfss2.1]|uniref:hypothetical protein n=1 Tax=Hyphomicrobium sp. 1Nfss2.1 TaxID=3413936 RepID=UPI003C7C7465